MPPTLKFGYPSASSSGSDERMINLINRVETTMRSLFAGDENEFVVTNDFVDQLVKLNAHALRAAARNQMEEALFSHWKENIENYRKAMFQATKPAKLGFTGREAQVVTREQLKQMFAICPKPPDFPTDRP